jgi:hypothetical protein
MIIPNYNFVYFDGTGVLIQGLKHARQALCHLSHSTSPFVCVCVCVCVLDIFETGSCICLGLEP